MRLISNEMICYDFPIREHPPIEQLSARYQQFYSVVYVETYKWIR